MNKKPQTNQSKFLIINWLQWFPFLLNAETPTSFDDIYSCPGLASLLSGEVLFLLERDSLKWLGCQVCDVSSFQLSLHSAEMWRRVAPQPSQYWYCTMAAKARAPTTNLSWQTMQHMNDSRCDIPNKERNQINREKRSLNKMEGRNFGDFYLI